MTKASKMKKCFYSLLITALVLSGVVVSGLIISTPQVALSQIPEPQCVCAGCGKKCGSGHTSSCPYRPK